MDWVRVDETVRFRQNVIISITQSSLRKTIQILDVIEYSISFFFKLVRDLKHLGQVNGNRLTSKVVLSNISTNIFDILKGPVCYSGSFFCRVITRLIN